MTTADVLRDRLREVGLLPIIHPPTAGHALHVASAVLAAGLPILEITLRAEGGLPGIEAVRIAHPSVLVGAGTVRTVDQARRAVEAGAQFLVTPALSDRVVDCAAALGIPIVPGVCTPTEVERAAGRGLQLLKFFPAGSAGGTGFLRALEGPFPEVSWIPTGGIRPIEVRDYLSLASVLAVGGSWLVAGDPYRTGFVDDVTQSVRAARLEVDSARPQEGVQR